MNQLDQLLQQHPGIYHLLSGTIMLFLFLFGRYWGELGEMRRMQRQHRELEKRLPRVTRIKIH